MPLLTTFPRGFKRGLLVALDAIACCAAAWLATCLRLDALRPPTSSDAIAGLISALVFVSIMWTVGQYRVVLRFMGWDAAQTLVRALAIHGVVFFLLVGAFRLADIPRSVGLIQPMLLALYALSSRLVAKRLLTHTVRPAGIERDAPVVIYGAGSAGRQVARSLLVGQSPSIVGFVDDDAALHGQTVGGLTVFPPDDLQSLCAEHEVHEILIAMPSATTQRRREIMAQLMPLGVRLRTLPDLATIVQGTASVVDFHDVQVDDLLGRAPVEPDHHLMDKDSRGHVVLVTGAGGSIGSELCRQVLSRAPAVLLLLDASEFALYAIHRELEQFNRLDKLNGQSSVETKIVPLLGSVCDEQRMQEIIRAWRPHVVYHAAAYKHVPLVEHNPAQGVMNNVFGTWTVAQCACAEGVPNFVLISTDKAVRPTNIMGATKRLAEMVLQALAPRFPDTKLSMVRFGNVLNSSGSVVPAFKQQIRDGGPITVTHPEITRFFMTIAEASQLVIQAGAMADSGDVFVLDMGEPVKIDDLARRMIALSGHSVRDAQHPKGSMEIVYTGLRPGEKLYEELLIGDNPQPTSHPRIMKAQEHHLPWEQLEVELNLLRQATATNDVPAIRTILQRVVSGYQPSSEIVDWVHTARPTTPAGSGSPFTATS